jgi:hypothetical protein
MATMGTLVLSAEMPRRADYHDVGHGLTVLWAAWIGGVFSRLCYMNFRRRSRE